MSDDVYDLHKIRKAINALGWKDNPFDKSVPFNKIVPVDPPSEWQGELVSGASRILAFQPGSGQTVALTRWLRRYFKSQSDQGKEDARYVVAVSFSSMRGAPTGLTPVVAESLATYVFRQRNDGYKRTSDQNKAAICRLITRSFPAYADLDGLFENLVDVDSAETRAELIKEIQQTAKSHIHSEESKDDSELELLKGTWPHGYHGLTIAVDIGKRHLSKDFRLPPRADSLLQFIEGNLLGESDICVKLGIPHCTKEFSSTVNRVSMSQWRIEDLRRLLNRRLQSIEFERDSGDYHDIEFLAGPDCRSSVKDYLLENANGSPTELFNLGSRLLEIYGSKLAYDVKARIQDTDLEQLIQTSSDFCRRMLEELKHYYNKEDLVKHLSFNLGVPYASLAGQSPFATLQQLLESLREHEGFERLLERCKHDYPEGHWPALPANLRGCP